MKLYLFSIIFMAVVYLAFFHQSDSVLLIAHENQSPEFRELRCDVLLTAQIKLDNENKFDQADNIADTRVMLGCINLEGVR